MDKQLLSDQKHPVEKPVNAGTSLYKFLLIELQETLGSHFVFDGAILMEGYFGVCGIAVLGVKSARYFGIKEKNWRYCGIDFLPHGMRYRYSLASKVHEIPVS